MTKLADLSFYRFNIAADLTEEARDVGLLGFSGILVWLRFMAMRQLIWNKNYNVKPRYISSHTVNKLLLIHLSSLGCVNQLEWCLRFHKTNCLKIQSTIHESGHHSCSLLLPKIRELQNFTNSRIDMDPLIFPFL